MDRFLKAALFRLLFFFVFTSVCSWLFVLVEYREEDDVLTKYNLLKSLYESMASKYNMTVDEFNNFSNVAYQALSQPKPQWTYFAAMEFVLQAVTTIGYGYITPQTSDGQLLCIFVCSMGIPLSLLTLKSVGQLIAHRIRTVVTTFERKVLKRQEVKQVKTKSAVILFLITMSSMIIYSRLLMRSENWTFVQSAYFWFVSFSTIGFGDFFVSAYKPIPIKQLLLNSPNANKIYEVNSEKAAIKGVRCISYGLLAMLALCTVSSVLNSVMAAIEELRYINHYCLICFRRKIQDRANNGEHNSTRNLNGDKSHLDMGNRGLQDDRTGKAESGALEEV